MEEKKNKTNKGKNKMNIDELTNAIAQLKEIAKLLGTDNNQASEAAPHPMVGRRCIIRTYTAGVHIGDVVEAKGKEVRLKNAFRLWSWSDGGLSLSAIANNGVVKGRLNYTGEVYLTEAVEFIPTTPEAEASFQKFIEDKK